MPTISRNIFWSTFTSILQLYTGSIIFIVLARLMSINDFGILSFGFSLSALVVISCDFGFSLMIIKDYPQLHKSESDYLSNSLWAKLILSSVSGLFFFIYLFIFYDGAWLYVGFLYVVFAIVSSYVVYLQALLRIENRFNKHSESTVVYSISITMAIFLYWFFSMDLIGLVWLMLFSRMLQLFWILYLSRRVLGSFLFEWSTVINLLKSSWSFGLHSVLGVFYFMIDTQIISIYLGSQDVALYQSAFRIILILLLFSDILTNVLLPYLSFKFYKEENISELTNKLFFYMLAIGCSMFLVFTSFKEEIITALYSSTYLEAVGLVLPLSIVVILRTSSALLGNLLTISNKQGYRVIAVGISLMVSLILNLIYVPIYGIQAAAWVSVVVHIILFYLYFYYSNLVANYLKLFQANNFLLVGTTTGLFWAINVLSPGNKGIIFICALLWIFTLIFLMNRDNNYTFLKQVLKEKGSG